MLSVMFCDVVFILVSMYNYIVLYIVIQVRFVKILSRT